MKLVMALLLSAVLSTSYAAGVKKKAPPKKETPAVQAPAPEEVKPEPLPESKWSQAFKLCESKDESACKRLTMTVMEACESANPNACFFEGYMYYRGIGLPKDLTRALVLFDDACSLNHGAGCLNLGYCLSNGIGIPKERRNEERANEIALKAYEKGCSLGYGQSCTAVGIVIQKQGTPESEKMALAQYQKACQLNDGRGCNNVGSYYVKHREIVGWQTKANDFFTKACDLRYSFGCSNLSALADFKQ